MSDPSEATKANHHPVSQHRTPHEIAKDEAGPIGRSDLDVIAKEVPNGNSPPEIVPLSVPPAVQPEISPVPAIPTVPTITPTTPIPPAPPVTLVTPVTPVTPTVTTPSRGLHH
jgi:hypothetical protein